MEIENLELNTNDQCQQVVATHKTKFGIYTLINGAQNVRNVYNQTNRVNQINFSNYPFTFLLH